MDRVDGRKWQDAGRIEAAVREHGGPIFAAFFIAASTNFMGVRGHFYE
jgi:hypothetical protein